MAEEVVKEVEKTVKTTIKLADRLWRDIKVYAEQSTGSLQEPTYPQRRHQPPYRCSARIENFI